MNILPAQEARTKAALDREMRINGQYQTRRAYIIDSIARGATIGWAEGQRALMQRNGSYMLESSISKTALDYAERLLEKRG